MTSVEIFLSLSRPVQIHIMCALIAVAIVPFVLWRQRKDTLHKIAGYTWVCAMIITAISSFWINEIRMVGAFGPIHILSVFTIFSVFSAVRSAIKRDFIAHSKSMRQIAKYALGIAGTFAFLPGRLMNRHVFGENGTLGFVLLAGVIGAGFAISWARNRRTIMVDQSE